MKLVLRVIAAACLLVACAPAEAPMAPKTAATEADVLDASGEAGMPSGPRAVDRAMPDQDFHISISEDRDSGVFNLHLTSLNAVRELCVGGAEWPDAHGRLEGAAGYVSLTSNGQGYAMEDSHVQCGEACVRHIAPGAQLDGFVGYDQFPQDAFDGAGPRTLNFGVEPYFCDSGEVE